MKLWDWQNRFLTWMSCRASAYLAADAGTGKTIATLSYLKLKKFQQVVIIAPLSAHPSWRADSKLLGVHIRHLYTYEKFVRMDVKKLPRCQFMILDEAHRVKTKTAKISELLLKHYADTPKLLLSGTPADRMWDLYSQYRIMDDNIWGNTSWTKWASKYFIMNEYHKPAYYRYPTAKDDIKKIIEPHTFRVALEDIADLPGMIVQEIRLPSSKRVRDVTKRALDEEQSPIAKFFLEYKIAQGIDPETSELFDTAKLNWALDYLKDHPDTIVFSAYRVPAIRLAEKLDCYLVLGDYKDELQDAIDKADKPLIATFCIKEGANLQKYHNVVYLSRPASYRDYHQSERRVYRAGQKEKVNIKVLVQEKKDDEITFILENKLEIHRYLKEGNYAETDYDDFTEA